MPRRRAQPASRTHSPSIRGGSSQPWARAGTPTRGFQQSPAPAPPPGGRANPSTPSRGGGNRPSATPASQSPAPPPRGRANPSTPSREGGNRPPTAPAPSGGGQVRPSASGSTSTPSGFGQRRPSFGGNNRPPPVSARSGSRQRASSRDRDTRLPSEIAQPHFVRQVAASTLAHHRNSLRGTFPSQGFFGERDSYVGDRNRGTPEPYQPTARFAEAARRTLEEMRANIPNDRPNDRNPDRNGNVNGDVNGRPNRSNRNRSNNPGSNGNGNRNGSLETPDGNRPWNANGDPHGHDGVQNGNAFFNGGGNAHQSQDGQPRRLVPGSEEYERAQREMREFQRGQNRAQQEATARTDSSRRLPQVGENDYGVAVDRTQQEPEGRAGPSRGQRQPPRSDEVEYSPLFDPNGPHARQTNTQRRPRQQNPPPQIGASNDYGVPYTPPANNRAQQEPEGQAGPSRRRHRRESVGNNDYGAPVDRRSNDGRHNNTSESDEGAAHPNGLRMNPP